MADDTTEPKMDKHINDDDIPFHDEIIEKPYYDKGSAPTIKNSIDNNQIQNQNSVKNPTPYYAIYNNIQPQYKITIIIIVSFNIIQCQEHQNKINKNILQ